MAALLGALQMFNGKLPPYTATLMVDLFSVGDDSQHVVEINYKNVTDSDIAYNLEVPGMYTSIQPSVIKPQGLA